MPFEIKHVVTSVAKVWFLKICALFFWNRTQNGYLTRKCSDFRIFFLFQLLWSPLQSLQMAKFASHPAN